MTNEELDLQQLEHLPQMIEQATDTCLKLKSMYDEFVALIRDDGGWPAEAEVRITAKTRSGEKVQIGEKIDPRSVLSILYAEADGFERIVKDCQEQYKQLTKKYGQKKNA